LAAAPFPAPPSIVANRHCQRTAKVFASLLISPTVAFSAARLDTQSVATPWSCAGSPARGRRCSTRAQRLHVASHRPCQITALATSQARMSEAWLRFLARAGTHCAAITKSPVKPVANGLHPCSLALRSASLPLPQPCKRLLQLQV
jgi:hypothetical protein